MQVIICAKCRPQTLESSVAGRSTRGATYARQGVQKARQQAHRASSVHKGAGVSKGFPAKAYVALVQEVAYVLTRARARAPAPMRIRACGVSRVRGKIKIIC